jgi:hypothetical protein
MLNRDARVVRRSLLSAVVAALCLGAVTSPASALNFIYLCLCCRPDGSVRYLAGWCNATCDQLSIFPAVVGCDTLFTALAVNPTGGVGTGYAPAFDRAIPLGAAIPSSTGGPDTRLVMGYYPAADPFVAGSYQTRVFAIRAGGPGRAVNQYAAININLTGLNPTAECVSTTSVRGGEFVTGPFDLQPIGLIGTGDATVVVQTFRATDPNVAVDTRLIPVNFASLTWVDAPPLPPACVGDCDRSGSVSFADITATLANFNQSYPVGVLTPGDANGDRSVSFADITAILANFGAVCQ